MTLREKLARLVPPLPKRGTLSFRLQRRMWIYGAAVWGLGMVACALWAWTTAGDGALEAFAAAALFGTAAILFLVLFLALACRRLLEEPFERLGEASEAYGMGDWEQPVPADLPDEIGGLAASIEGMADQLKDAFDSIEDRFQALVSQTGGVVYRCSNDRHWTLEVVGAGIEGLTGYPESEFTGEGGRALQSLVHPEDRQRVGETLAAALEAGESFELEYRINRDDGGIRWVCDRGAGVFDDDGNLIRRSGELTDITERVLFEDQLRAAKEAAETANRTMGDVLAHLPIQVAMADAALRVTYINPAMLRGLERVAEHLTVKADQVVGAKLDGLLKDPAPFGRLLADPEQLPLSERLRLGDEVVDATVSPIYDSAGHYRGPMVTWSFVTRQMRLEEEKRERAARDRRETAELQAKVDGMLATVQAAERGDLTRGIAVEGDDAIGQMGLALGHFLGELRGTVKTVSKSAQAMSEASANLNQVSRRMEGDAGQTSAQVDAASASAATVSDSLQTISAALEQTTSGMSEILQSAHKASHMAQRAVEVSQTNSVAIEELGLNSAAIEGVIKLIRTIADQTNLLALNATIEAARAGAAGKGFIVVANEVKDLARSTAEATAEITAKVEAIQGSTRQVSEAIAQVRSLVGQINQLQAGIAASVEEQTASSAAVSSSISKAADGSVSISTSMEEVAAVAQSTVSGASQTRGAAASMAAIAEELESFVQRFKVEKEGERKELGDLLSRIRATGDVDLEKLRRTLRRDGAGDGDDG